MLRQVHLWKSIVEAPRVHHVLVGRQVILAAERFAITTCWSEYSAAASTACSWSIRSAGIRAIWLLLLSLHRMYWLLHRLLLLLLLLLKLKLPLLLLQLQQLLLLKLLHLLLLLPWIWPCQVTAFVAIVAVAAATTEKVHEGQTNEGHRVVRGQTRLRHLWRRCRRGSSRLTRSGRRRRRCTVVG